MTTPNETAIPKTASGETIRQVHEATQDARRKRLAEVKETIDAIRMLTGEARSLRQQVQTMSARLGVLDFLEALNRGERLPNRQEGGAMCEDPVWLAERIIKTYEGEYSRVSQDIDEAEKAYKHSEALREKLAKETKANPLPEVREERAEEWPSGRPMPENWRKPTPTKAPTSQQL